jgi:hypothetical protein
MTNVTLSSRSYKLRSKLYLNEHSIQIEDAQVIPVQNAPINHVFCCDVSGSMYRSLPKMRKQLKNRIAEIVRPEDTITIIAFSSPTVCYVLKEMAKVNTPEQLSALQAAIDRYLVPNGWTDFVPPIKATEKLINENSGNWNWIFLSDGGHNDGPFSDVVNALNTIQGKVANATIIEYGYYADSQRLSEMAELLGGTKIQAEDFDTYVPVFESAIKGTIVAPVVEIDVTSMIDSLKYKKFFYINDSSKSIHVLSPKEGKLLVPAYVKNLITISTKIVGDYSKSKKLKAPLEDYYASVYVMADLLNYNLVDDILASLGDIKFINLYQDSFGKQKLFAFQREILSAVFDSTARGEIDENYTPVDSSYCVIDFFNELMSDDNQIKVVDPAFAYKRIGAKAVDKVELTDEEKQKLTSAKTKKDVDKIVDAAADRSVKMTMVNKGYPVSDFTWNEERANLSALMKIDVILDLPKNDVGLSQLQSFVFRNYTIIKDGVLNINSLPVILSEETFNKFKENPRLIITDAEILEDGKYECIIDISALPVINRKRVRASKMKKMTKLALQLMDYKFQLKYLGYLKKEVGTFTYKSVPGFGAGFTAEQWTYLESIGITSNGYSPKKELDKNGDYYMALTLNSNFKGFSSIPAIESIDKKLKAGKSLTPSEKYLQLVMAFVDKKYLGNTKGDAYKDAINSAFNALTIKKRSVAEELSQMKFAMIISRKWFSDCESMDQNVDTIVSDFGPELTIEYRFVDKKQNL